jgi:hypothetical protein
MAGGTTGPGEWASTGAFLRSLVGAVRGGCEPLRIVSDVFTMATRVTVEPFDECSGQPGRSIES